MRYSLIRSGGLQPGATKHPIFDPRWLGIWIDSKMTLKEHHSARVVKARKAMHCIRRLTGRLGMCPDACRRALVACVQASAPYGAELWWDDWKGS